MIGEYAVHFPSNVTPEMKKRIIGLLKRPTGSLEFKYQLEGLFDPKIGKGIILQIVSGQIIYHIERDADLNMHFYHSTPGTKTRVATVNIKHLIGSKRVFIAITWSPEEISLNVGGLGGNSNQLLRATGVPSKISFRVDPTGAVYHIGDSGVTIGEYSVFIEGKPMLQSTAIEAWNNTIEAVKILHTGTSPQGYIFEVICTNLTIVMLVTGFETYCKRRFVELEQEGISPDVDALLDKFLSNKEKERGEAELIKVDAQTASVSPVQLLIDRGKIDFQNYDRCKLAYNRAYGIKFGEMKGITSALLEDIQRIIGFRHQIVHISPMMGMLNQGHVPPEEPIFPKHEYAQKVIDMFSGFINSLHSATLKLRPN